MVLFKYFKHKMPQKFSYENFIGSNPRKFSPVNISMFVVKVDNMVEVGIHILSHLKEELAWAVDKRLWVISTIVLFKCDWILENRP